MTTDAYHLSTYYLKHIPLKSQQHQVRKLPAEIPSKKRKITKLIKIKILVK